MSKNMPAIQKDSKRLTSSNLMKRLEDKILERHDS